MLKEPSKPSLEPIGGMLHKTDTGGNNFRWFFWKSSMYHGQQGSSCPSKTTSHLTTGAARLLTMRLQRNDGLT